MKAHIVEYGTLGGANPVTITPDAPIPVTLTITPVIDEFQASLRSMILGQAVAHHGCQWPEGLTGAMYFNGQRFTQEEFNERVAAAKRAWA